MFLAADVQHVSRGRLGYDYPCNGARFLPAKKTNKQEERKAGLDVELLSRSDAISARVQFMWNSRKYAVMAIAVAGLAVTAATPASACFAWGHSGIYSYGWAYANTGFADYPAYSYRSCGGNYQIQGWGECGGYGPCGWAPFPPLVVTVPVTDTAAPGVRVTRARRGRADRRHAQGVER